MRRDDPYAPSWSWTSITGRINFLHNHKGLPFECLAEVLEISWRPVSVNPFGALIIRHIKIKGLLATIPGNIEQRGGPQMDMKGTFEGYWIWVELVLEVTKPVLEIASKDKAVIII